MRNTSKQSEAQSQLTTANQLCWWMLAGVVDYKLCDREFDCDHCPFDLSLHGGINKVLKGSNEVTGCIKELGSLSNTDALEPSDALNFDCEDNLFYHPGHVWVRVEESGNVRIGLDDFAQKILGRVYAISLPKEGFPVSAGEPCWRITHKAGETTLPVPLSGEVIQVNSKLTQCPSLLNREPYGAGWAFMIKPTDLETGLRNLFYGTHAVDWHMEESERLYSQLSRFTGGNRAGVATMPDGGMLRKDFLSALSAEQARDLIESFLPVHSMNEKSRNKDTAILNLKRR